MKKFSTVYVRTLLRLAPVFTLMATCTMVQAIGSLPISEEYNYTAGTDIGGTAAVLVTGWTNGLAGTTLGGNTPKVASGNLSYPGLATSAGNSLTNAAGAAAQGIRLAPGAGATFGSSGNVLWYSALLKINSLGTLTTNGEYIISLNNTVNPANTTADPTTIPGRTFVRASTNSGKFNIGFEVGYGTTSDTVDYGAAPVDFSPGSTVFIVVAYTNSVAPQKGAMWINPDPSAFGGSQPAQTITRTPTTTMTVVTLGSLLVLSHTNTTPSYTLDELRFGASWASVTPAGPPGFTNTWAAIQTNNAGSTVTLNHGTTGPGTLTYQWKKNGSNLTDGGDVSGSTTGILTITGIGTVDAASYALVVTSNPNGTSTSATSVLVINDPYIATQPVASQNVPPGSTLNISLTAFGAGLTYQWKFGGVNLTDDGTHILGSTTSNLTLVNVSAADNGSYA